MVRYNGIDCFQGWLVIRGGPETARCCRKTWYKVRSVIISFCGGFDYQRHFRWSLVASLVETRNSGRESLNVFHGNKISTLVLTECAKRWQDTLNPAIDRRQVYRHIGHWLILILRLPVRGVQKRCGQTFAWQTDIILTVSIRTLSYWMPLRRWARVGPLSLNLTSLAELR